MRAWSVTNAVATTVTVAIGYFTTPCFRPPELLATVGHVHPTTHYL